MEKSNNELWLILIPLGVGLNIGLATIINLLKVPVYLDAIGTIVITLILGLRGGILTGVLSFVLMTATGLGPYHIYFSGTQIAIALVIYFVSSKGFFKSIWKVIITGIFVGVIAAIVSAPVIVYLFGGIEANGPGLITAFLAATGKTITQSVILKGVSVEPVDKTIQCLLAFTLIKSLPKSLLKKFHSHLIEKNFL